MGLRPSWWGYNYTVLLLTWLGWVSIYFVKGVLPPVLPVLSLEMGLSHTQAGLLETAYLIGYLVVKMPAGVLSNKYGPRRVLAVSMMGYGAASAATTMARGFRDIFILRLFVGLFQGFHLPVVNALLSDRFGEKQGKAIGFNESGPNIGNTLALPLTVSIMSMWSWRIAFLALSLPAFALSMIALILMKEEPRRQMTWEGRRSNIRDYWRVLFPFAVAHGIYNLMLRTVFTFMPSFLVENRGMDFSTAGFLATAIPLAGIIAKISSGFLAERVRKRYFISGAITLSSLFLASLVILPRISYVTISLVALGLTLYSFSPIIYASTVTVLPSGLKATGLGAVTMFGNIVGAVSTSFIGKLIDTYGYGVTFNTVTVISLTATAIIYLIQDESDA
jgi:ACS family glucarate transporter-like MFS transporter